jgi:DUF4097 and DUF4098 domain-containing protein YvlB
MKRPIVITLLIVALALVCVGIGSVIYFANGFPANNPFERRNITSILEESKTLKVDSAKPITLKVTNYAGDVTIIGGNVETMQVEVARTAYASSQAKADEELKTVKYSVEQAGNTIIIKYEYLKNVIAYDNLNTVDFVITVPTEITVNVDAGLGKVSVANTKGNVDVKNDFGDVTLENIEGALSAKTNSGKVTATFIVAGTENIDLSSDFGEVILKKAGGRDISLDLNSGNITLSEVRATGNLTANTDFGNTKFENGSADGLHVENNSGKVSLVKLNISKLLFVKNDFGDIDLEQAMAGSYDMHTNSGDITVDGAKGTLKAKTDFGNVTITNAQSVTLTVETNSGTIEFSGSLGVGPHMVKSDFGAIDISLPAEAKLTVDLKTDFGKIKSELPVTVILTDGARSDGDQIAGDVNGGGEQLTVQANSGNITIHVKK